MHIIPVIDIMHGQVVQARHGRRDHYRPLSSCLTTVSTPEAVIRALLALYPFKILYIADLDAIQNMGSHYTIIASLVHTFPDTLFWIDAGWEGIPQYTDMANTVAIYGTENGVDTDRVQRLLRHYPETILSLDLDTPIGASDHIANTLDIWPDHVIVMSLYQVGSGLGPDYASLKQVKQRAGDKRIYAAGGIREHSDLLRLETMGIHGALLASGLHNGRLTAPTLSTWLTTKKMPR